MRPCVVCGATDHQVTEISTSRGTFKAIECPNVSCAIVFDEAAWRQAFKDWAAAPSQQAPSAAPHESADRKSRQG